MKKINWLHLVEKYSKTRYRLGSKNRHRGLDCLSLMILFLDEIYGNVREKFDNDDFVFEYNGKQINKDNYYTEITSHKEMSDCFSAFIRKYFNKVNELKRGYIVLNSYKEDTFPFIYLGRGKFLTMNPIYGFNLININIDNIVEIYKW